MTVKKTDPKKDIKKDVKKDVKQDQKTKTKKPISARRKFIMAGGAVLVILIALGGVFTKEPIFGMDGLFGFYAVFGLLSALGFVVISQFILGPLLKRKDSYYDD